MLDTRALVVEDEEAIRRQLVRTVKRVIAEVDDAADGAQAQRLFEQHEYPLVLLDLRLPKVDGMEVLRRIKRLHPASEVIILSAHGDRGDAVEALNLHAFRYLEKPANVPDIEDALREAYERFSLTVAGAAAPDALQGTSPWKFETEIRDLYEQLAKLTAQRKQAPKDDSLQREHEAVFQRLRQVQQVEAQRASAAFRAHLTLPRGQGYRSLQAAREELSGGTSESLTRSSDAARDADPKAT